MRAPVLLLQAANFCSGLGNAMVTIAIPWLVMERLGSATLAGLVLAAASLPPLYPTVPQASRNDPRLHDALALVDALRAGAAREREMARELFKEMIA